MRTSLKIISILKSFSYTSTDNSFTPSIIIAGFMNYEVLFLNMR